MSSLNQCNFIGNLGKDVETFNNGCRFSIGCNWKSKDKEGTDWVNVTAFGKLAEICQTYLKKGSKVFISGQFKTDKYEKDGETRYSSGIVARDMVMLDVKPSSQPVQQQSVQPQGNDLNDDIPF